VTTPVPVTDGRSARSQRTREAVVDALLALIREGCPRPTAKQIAERASISLRSVYVHFDDLEDLFLAVAQRQMALVGTMIEPISSDLPLRERIEAMCTLRARIFEEVGPVRRAAEMQAPFSRTLSQLMTDVRKGSRDGIATVFAPELAGLSAAARRRRIGALDAALSGESWDLLRGTHGMSFAEAYETMVWSAGTLLAGEGR
jgi:TetR/AcrR family transcriptional regulator, regulator of autoinduction and epiphytic fitness